MFALPRSSRVFGFIFTFKLVMRIAEVGHDLVEGESGLV